MKKYYLGILIITCVTYASSNTQKRFGDYDAHDTNEWNWISKDQVADAQSSQVSWPPRNGNGATVKGKGDWNPNRDGSWVAGTWPSGDTRNDSPDMGWNAQPQGNNKGSDYPDQGDNQEGDLETLLRGIPGMDFPNFSNLPDTDFDCSSMPSQGYYGDVEAGCQVFHICQPGNRKDSFLCPIGTIFNQKYFVCDWWFNVNCSDTPSYYELNNEVYKEPAIVADELPVTTEKSMPWDSQDPDKNKSTKSWGNQPSTGKQNPNWKSTPARRGSKSSGPVSTSREVSNTWSRSDVQKEVTLSWGASSHSPSETYASSSTASNSITPTAKPIWYSIDGQTTKDQINGMSKRVGLTQTSAPFGTRIRKTKGRATTKPDETAMLSTKQNNHKTTTPDIGMKGTDIAWPSPPTASWQKQTNNADTFKTENGITGTNNVDYDYSTTKTWKKDEHDRETSINPTGIKGVWEQQVKTGNDLKTPNNPTGIKGVWEQQTTNRMDPENSNNPTGVKGIWEQHITKKLDPEIFISPSGTKGVWEQQTTRRSVDNSFVSNSLKNKSFDHKFTFSGQNRKTLENTSSPRNEWNERRSSTAVNRDWVRNNARKRKDLENSNVNTIQRRLNWK